MVMHFTALNWVGITLFMLVCSAQGAATRTVEVPISKTGEVQVAEILARLTEASGVALDRPGADLSLSTQGLAGPLTKALLVDSLGPEVAISFQRGAMIMTIDDRILAATAVANGSADLALWPLAPKRPLAHDSRMACVP